MESEKESSFVNTEKAVSETNQSKEERRETKAVIYKVEIDTDKYSSQDNAKLTDHSNLTKLSPIVQIPTDTMKSEPDNRIKLNFDKIESTNLENVPLEQITNHIQNLRSTPIIRIQRSPNYLDNASDQNRNEMKSITNALFRDYQTLNNDLYYFDKFATLAGQFKIKAKHELNALLKEFRQRQRPQAKELAKNTAFYSQKSFPLTRTGQQNFEEEPKSQIKNYLDFDKILMPKLNEPKEVQSQTLDKNNNSNKDYHKARTLESPTINSVNKLMADPIKSMFSAVEKMLDTKKSNVEIPENFPITSETNILLDNPVINAYGNNKGASWLNKLFIQGPIGTQSPSSNEFDFKKLPFREPTGSISSNQTFKNMMLQYQDTSEYVVDIISDHLYNLYDYCVMQNNSYREYIDNSKPSEAFNEYLKFEYNTFKVKKPTQQISWSYDQSVNNLCQQFVTSVIKEAIDVFSSTKQNKDWIHTISSQFVENVYAKVLQEELPNLINKQKIEKKNSEYISNVYKDVIELPEQVDEKILSDHEFGPKSEKHKSNEALANKSSQARVKKDSNEKICETFVRDVFDKVLDHKNRNPNNLSKVQKLCNQFVDNVLEGALSNIKDENSYQQEVVTIADDFVDTIINEASLLKDNNIGRPINFKLAVNAVDDLKRSEHQNAIRTGSFNKLCTSFVDKIFSHVMRENIKNGQEHQNINYMCEEFVGNIFEEAVNVKLSNSNQNNIDSLDPYNISNGSHKKGSTNEIGSESFKLTAQIRYIDSDEKNLLTKAENQTVNKTSDSSNRLPFEKTQWKNIETKFRQKTIAENDLRTDQHVLKSPDNNFEDLADFENENLFGSALKAQRVMKSDKFKSNLHLSSSNMQMSSKRRFNNFKDIIALHKSNKSQIINTSTVIDDVYMKQSQIGLITQIKTNLVDRTNVKTSVCESQMFIAPDSVDQNTALIQTSPIEKQNPSERKLFTKVGKQNNQMESQHLKQETAELQTLRITGKQENSPEANNISDYLKNQINGKDRSNFNQLSAMNSGPNEPEIVDQDINGRMPDFNRPNTILEDQCNDIKLPHKKYDDSLTSYNKNDSQTIPNKVSFDPNKNTLQMIGNDMSPQSNIKVEAKIKNVDNNELATVSRQFDLETDLKRLTHLDVQKNTATKVDSNINGSSKSDLRSFKIGTTANHFDSSSKGKGEMDIGLDPRQKTIIQFKNDAVVIQKAELEEIEHNYSIQMMEAMNNMLKMNKGKRLSNTNLRGEMNKIFSTEFMIQITKPSPKFINSIIRIQRAFRKRKSHHKKEVPKIQPVVIPLVAVQPSTTVFKRKRKFKA